MRRPSEPAHFWQDEPDILGGRDQAAGGTWLAVTRGGRFSLLTNIREVDKKPGAPSRGNLTVDFLKGTAAPEDYLAGLDAQRFNGFNLLVGDLRSRRMAYLSNRGSAVPMKLEPGLYGISNGLMHDAWPKVERGKEMIQSLLEGSALDGCGGGSLPWNDIFDDVLGDTTKATDQTQLPQTSLPPEWEQELSSIFIERVEWQGEPYGTRSQIVLAVTGDGRAELRERFLGKNGSWQSDQHRFHIHL